MQLREYLFKNKLSRAKFSRSINYTKSYLNQVMRGMSPLGEKLIRSIEKETHGQVSQKDLQEEIEDNIREKKEQSSPQDIPSKEAFLLELGLLLMNKLNLNYSNIDEMKEFINENLNSKYSNNIQSED
jgi:DNA-binding transcriptional regulator YdaS (Cro superfamily)